MEFDTDVRYCTRAELTNAERHVCVKQPGYKYDGEYNEKNQRHGIGHAEFHNGDIFDGHYESGKRHGLGVYKWAVTFCIEFSDHIYTINVAYTDFHDTSNNRCISIIWRIVEIRWKTQKINRLSAVYRSQIFGDVSYYVTAGLK